MKRWKTVLFATLTFDDDHCKKVSLFDAMWESFTRDRLAYDKKYYKEHGKFPDDYPPEIWNGMKKRKKLVESLRQRPQWEFPKYQTGYDYMHPGRVGYGTQILVPDKDGFVKFLKRLRENIVNHYAPRHWDEDAKKMVRSVSRSSPSVFVKYLYCCEYGPNTLRPHYHLILFSNMSYHFLRGMVKLTWKNGYCDVSKVEVKPNETVTQAVMSYVSKYIYKPEFFENPYITSGILPRPHRGQSHGIGERYVDEVLLPNIKHVNELYKDKIKGDYHGYNRDYIKVLRNCFRVFSGGYVYNLPRYYKNLVLPQKLVRSVSMDYKTRTEVEREVWRVDGDAPISVALTSDVLDTLDEDFQREFEDIRRQHPEMSAADISLLLCDIHDAELRARDKASFAKLHDAYFKNARKYSM